MIKLQIIGNLGKDCTVTDYNGKQIVNFAVAHTEKYKDGQGVQHEKTTWVQCSWFRDNANGIAQYLKRSQQVYVNGVPELRHYTDNNGKEGTSLNLRVLDLTLCGNQNNSERRLATEGNHYSQQPYVNPERQSTGANTISNDNLNF